MRSLVTLAVTTAVASPALAANIDVEVTLPRLNVAEYHKPYVAIWIEKPDQSFVGNLAVWYDVGHREGEGSKWLKDLRQWWRRSGRELALPVDGVTGPTRPPGTQVLHLAGDGAVLGKLAPGDYQLVVEAAREVGGRELVRLPFKWPLAAGQVASAQGKDELGAVALSAK